jgi:hypothetical protein
MEQKADDAGKPTDEDVTEVIFPKNGTSVPSTKVSRGWVHP